MDGCVFRSSPNLCTFLQVVGGSHGAQVKLSDGSVKTVTAAGHLSKPGTTTLRMTGGVITAASPTSASVTSVSATANQQQASVAVIVLEKHCVLFKCS